MQDYSYSNLQIRTTDAEAVRASIDVCNIGSAKMLARVDVQWVSVYPFLTEDDFAWLKVVAEKMSCNLKVPIVGILVPRPSEFKYAIYDGMKLLDEYHLAAGTAEMTAVWKGGNADVLAPFCAEKQTKKTLEALIHPKEILTPEKAGDRMAQQFAQLLGIPRAQVCTGFNHLKWAQAGR